MIQTLFIFVEILLFFLSVFPLLFFSFESSSLEEVVFWSLALSSLIEAFLLYIFQNPLLALLRKKEKTGKKNSYLIGVCSALFMICGYFAGQIEQRAYIIDELENETPIPLTEQEKAEKPYISTFPREPLHYKKALPVPGTEVLYDEYVYLHPSNQLIYSISSIEVPQNLLKWGESLILKGCLKEIVKSTPGMQLISSKKSSFGPYKCIDYIAKTESKQTFSRLLLAGNTLYKIEVRCKDENRELALSEAGQFFDAFTLEK